MERNTKTTIGQLKPGDRFYRLNDKSKKLYTMQEGSIKFASGKQNYGLKDGDTYKVYIKEDTEVIFLRSKI